MDAAANAPTEPLEATASEPAGTTALVDRRDTNTIDNHHTIMTDAAAAAAAAPVENNDAVTVERADSIDPRQQQPATTATINHDMAVARAPLTDLYGPFVLDTDTSLQDARQRLKTALKQTMELRQAFTERVYDKYRICLVPPIDRTEIIRQEPASMYSKLLAERASLKEEKELERRTQSEEMGYFSAGLSLVILPEQEVVDPAIIAAYPDRYNQAQRVKNLSQAGIAAGDAILDRKRRAIAMRFERHRIQQGGVDGALGVLPSIEMPMSTIRPDVASFSNVHPTMARKRKMSELSAVSAPSVQKKQPSPTPPRQRQQGGALSVTALLSLAPGADEILTDAHPRPSAATKALIAKTHNAKSTQQRLKHPHPDSFGGKRRASQSSSSKEPFLQAYLALTLPPLPVPKDKSERKPLPLRTDAATGRSREAVKKVLQLFDGESSEVSKIQLQLGLNKLKKDFVASERADSKTSQVVAAGITVDAELPPPPRPVSEEPAPGSLIDPILTYSVLEALGLLQEADIDQTGGLMRPLNQEYALTYSDDLRGIRQYIEQSDSAASLTEQILLSPETDIILEERVTAGPIIPVESIRGGGGSDESSVPLEMSTVEKGKKAANSQEMKDKMSSSGKRKSSDPDEAVAGMPSISRRKISDPGLTEIEQQTQSGAPSVYNGQHLHDAYNMDLPQFSMATGSIQPGYNQFSTQIHSHPAMYAQSTSRPPQLHPAGPPGYSHTGNVLGALFGNQSIPAIYPHLSQQQPRPSDFPLPAVTCTSKNSVSPQPDGMLRSRQKSEYSSASELGAVTRTNHDEVTNSKTLTLESAPALRASGDSGMQFLEPDEPASLPEEKAELIKNGRFSDIEASACSVTIQASAIEYLMAVGSSVPIPKALVSNPFKEKIASPGFRSVCKQSLPNASRDLAVATILVWLWANHEDSFQRAFEKSGRVDVDPDCKWLIQAAIDTAVRGLAFEIADQVKARTGPLVDLVDTKKNPASQKQATAASTTSESSSPTNSRQVDICVSTTVSKALTDKICVSNRLNKAIPRFQNYLDYLDELRLCALRAKAKERVLLANIVAKKATMNEAFASAYVSSVVRAGEILGQDKLFEAVQDAETSTCSMMPHDILTAEGDTWEDPGKPEQGYTIGLTGNDLMRRAHARAMIHKSLKKLQDRNNVRGGVPDFGPYVDPNLAASVPTAQVLHDTSMSPRVDHKKRRPSLADMTVPSGTGSIQARAWSQYEPRHVCEPVSWQPNLVENTPYGLHRRGEVVRSLSVSLSSRSGEPRSMKKSKRAMDAAAAPVFAPVVVDASAAGGDDAVPRSTQEINWAEVAGIFQKVEVPRKNKEDPAVANAARYILAPNCRRIDSVALQDGESDTEEDLTDETVLGKHQEILNVMKEKIAQYFEKRKEQMQDRRRKNIVAKKQTK